MKSVMEMPFDKLKYDREFQKQKTKLFTVRLNLANDADILAWLDKQANKQGTVKALIRAEIEKESR